MVSFIPQRVCDHALSTVRVVELAEVTLGQKLITTKKWIEDLYTGSLSCTCDLYPRQTHGCTDQKSTGVILLFFDSMGISVHGATSMSHVHSRC